MNSRYFAYPAVGVALALAPVAATAQGDDAKVKEVVEIATDAYVYGYSLVTTNLKYNPDGSLTLYFQNESPGKDKEANWLPAPKGEFIPMMRMYWPKEKAPSVLDGSWAPPQIQKTNN